MARLARTPRRRALRAGRGTGPSAAGVSRHVNAQRQVWVPRTITRAAIIEKMSPDSDTGLALRDPELSRHPVGCLVAVAVPEIVHHVVAALDHRKHARARHRLRELL